MVWYFVIWIPDKYVIQIMTGFKIQQKSKLVIYIKRSILLQLSLKQVTRWSRTQSFPVPSTKRSRSPSGIHPQQPPWPQWQWSAHKLRHMWPRQSGLRLHKTPSIPSQHSADQKKKRSSYKITILSERKTQTMKETKIVIVIQTFDGPNHVVPFMPRIKPDVYTRKKSFLAFYVCCKNVKF